jgi:hypothetical protein
MQEVLKFIRRIEAANASTARPSRVSSKDRETLPGLSPRDARTSNISNGKAKALDFCPQELQRKDPIPTNACVKRSKLFRENRLDAQQARPFAAQSREDPSRIPFPQNS